MRTYSEKSWEIASGWAYALASDTRVLAAQIDDAFPQYQDWQTMESAPRDGTEILLHYKSFCGHKDLVVSGHWDDTQGPDNATWENSCGSGDADHWMPLPKPPNPFHPSP